MIVNDKIRTEFSELSCVSEVYEYIKNNYMPEFYCGSRKGSMGVFEEKVAEAFKKDIVGKAGSKFNIIYDKSTGKVYLETVQSPHKYVPTDYTVKEWYYE